jgi:hypothetical protein
MRAMKVFAAIIVSLVLLATQAAALILGAVRTSLTAEAISGAIKNADLSGAAARPGPPLLTVRPRLFGAGGYEALELGDEDLEELSGALTRGGLKDVLGGLLRDRADRLGIKPEEADEIAEAVLKTDAAADFIGTYASGVLTAALYGSEMPALSERDIAELAESVIGELPVEIRDKIDAEALRGYMEEAAPSIAESFNSAAVKTAAPAGQTGAIAAHMNIKPQVLKVLRLALGGKLLMGLLVVSVILGLLLILLFLKSGAGLLWWAAVSAAAALPFAPLRFAASLAARLPANKYAALLLGPLMGRLRTYGLYMLGFAAFLILLYAIIKLVRRGAAIRSAV